MGFFGDLLKREAKKLVSDIVGNALDSVTGSTSNNVNERRTTDNTSDVFSKIKHVVATEFTEYELRENVNSSELGGESGAASYTYGIYRNCAPVIMINVFTDRNEYKLKRYRLAKEAAEFSGVTYLRFFSHLPNEISYITERLKANM